MVIAAFKPISNFSPGNVENWGDRMVNDRFTGLMQDDVLWAEMTKEIYELHTMPAKSDLHPVSGYLEFRQGETNKSFIISARDDNEEEGRRINLSLS